MNYFDAKFFHIMMGYILLSNLFFNIYNGKNIVVKISYGINSLFLFISGIYLLNRLGITASQLSSYPFWLWMKLLAWMLLATLPPILNKRAPILLKKSSLFFVVLFIFASYLGIYKI